VNDAGERPRRTITEGTPLQEQLVEAQKLEVAGRLATGVAHNFNNMLLIILGNASLALSRLDRPVRGRAEDLRHIGDRCRRRKG